MYNRKTRTLFSVQGYYAFGWESVCCETTRRDATANAKLYRESEPQTSFRIHAFREAIACQ